MAARASLPSGLGSAGRGLPAPTSPPWLTLRGSAASALLPGRGKLLLQPSQLPGSGSALGSARVKDRQGWSELMPCGSVGSCLPRAFQVGRGSAEPVLGSIAAAGLRKGASVGTGRAEQWVLSSNGPRGWLLVLGPRVSIRHHPGWAPMGAGHPPESGTLPRCPCPPVPVGSSPHASLLGANGGDGALCPGGWCDPPPPRHPWVTHLWTQSACVPSGKGGSLQSCPRCPLQAQPTSQHQRARGCRVPPAPSGGGVGWGGG